MLDIIFLFFSLILFNNVRYLEFLLFPRSCPYMLKVPFTHLYDYEHLNVNLTYELRLSANGPHKCESYYLLLFF